METIISSKKLTARYVVYQIIFFSFSAGISAFAATYLLAKGLNASQVGLLLAVSNLLSCFTQPIIGDFADRLKRFLLPQIVALIFTGVIICLVIIQFLNPSLGVFGLLYGMALFLSSITNSLNNSLCAYYTNHNCPINYGVGQGVGSFSFSIASLAYGYIMAGLGVDSMMWIVLLLAILLIVVVLGYPKLPDSKIVTKGNKEAVIEERVSIFQFFVKYKLFVFTMFGVLLVSMCHAMSENYFIAIFQSIGGGSEDVGVAMFVACLSAVPFFIFFEKLRVKFGIHIFLRTAGVFFILKTLLLILATEIWHVYLIQLLQTFTYGFIYQPLYYLARQRISQADLVKGQAVTVALYTLGAASGSFVGGKAIDFGGVDFELWLALGIAFAGAVIINGTLGKERQGNN